MNIWMIIAIAAIIVIIFMFYTVIIEGLKTNKQKTEEEREKNKYESEQMAKRAIEKDALYNKIIDLQNKTIEEPKQVSKKREYSSEEKKAYAIKQREFRENLTAKGRKYEAFVAEHFQELGYDVLEHGKEYGKLDKGIDLIAKKDNEIIIIQCKNWRAGGKFSVDHAIVKEFIGNVATFLDKNAIYKDYIVKKIFAVSERVLDKSAMEFITANKQTIRYLHLPMKDSNPEG